MEIKISVIVAVYQAETHLKRCLDSLLSQSFREFEIILINDGSIDDSGKICDEYAKQDDRIRVFHKDNGGVSSARNWGIRNVRGKFSIHIDADDYVESNMLSDLFERVVSSDADIVVCDFFVKRYSEIRVVKQGAFSNSSDCIQQILLGKLHGSTCNKLVRHDLYRDNCITFPEDLSIGEDMFVVISLMLKANQIDYLPKAYYYYVDNAASITNSKSAYYYSSKIRLANKIETLFAGQSDNITYLNEFKLLIRKDILLLKHPIDFVVKDIFPETNTFIMASKVVPTWLKVALLAEIYNFSILKAILLRLNNMLRSSIITG